MNSAVFNINYLSASPMPKTEKYENTPEGLFEPEKQLQQEGMILFDF
jgi:hypothetical protein